MQQALQHSCGVQRSSAAPGLRSARRTAGTLLRHPPATRCLAARPRSTHSSGPASNDDDADTRGCTTATRATGDARSALSRTLSLSWDEADTEAPIGAAVNSSLQTSLQPQPALAQQPHQHLQAAAMAAVVATPSAASVAAGVAAAGASVATAVKAAVPLSPAGWQRRWTVVGLCFFAFLLCNMDRVNMAVAVLPMREMYGWDTVVMGKVQASFFMGYLCTQIPGGLLAKKFGGKFVLGAGVVWWSLATMLTPWAADSGLITLCVVRALMGIGEGVAMPAMNQLLSRWVPVQERSRSLSLVYSGMFLGSTVGLTLSPQIIQTFGWPSVFWGFGSLGLIWIVLWLTQAASDPTADKQCSAEELAFIQANTVGGPPVDIHAGSSSQAVAVSGQAAGSTQTEQIPWKLLFSRKEVWAIIVCHFCHNWGTFILLTWMPSYYSQVLGLDLASSSILSCLPWITMTVTANLGGWIADSAIGRGVSVTNVRKIMQTIGFLGPAFFLSQLSSVDTVPAAVLCMMGAQGLDAFSQSGLYSNHADIAPRYSGVLLGISNTAGVLAGVAGSLATGFILQHGTWSQVWQVAIALYLVGTVVWNTFATGEKVID